MNKRLFGWFLICLLLGPGWVRAAVPNATPLAAPAPEHVIAAVLLAEAGGEGRSGLAAVMEVIQTRAKKKRTTWYRVVMEPRQFACLNRATPVGLVNKAKSHPLWPEAVRLASRGTPTYLARGATHYEMKSRRPKWANRATVTAIVGNHAFYRINGAI